MSRNVIRSSPGPWGSVRVEIRPGAMYSLAIWIDGKAQMPVHGLEADEASSLADEIISERSNELLTEYERRLDYREVELIAHHYEVFEPHVINNVMVQANRWPALEKVQRREACHREFHDHAQSKSEVAPVELSADSVKGMDDMAAYATGGVVSGTGVYRVGERTLPYEMTKEEAQRRLAQLRADLAARV